MKEELKKRIGELREEYNFNANNSEAYKVLDKIVFLEKMYNAMYSDMYDEI